MSQPQGPQPAEKMARSDNNNNNSNDLQGVPADARYVLGMSYPSSARQHVLTMKTQGQSNVA